MRYTVKELTGGRTHTYYEGDDPNAAFDSWEREIGEPRQRLLKKKWHVSTPICIWEGDRQLTWGEAQALSEQARHERETEKTPRAPESPIAPPPMDGTCVANATPRRRGRPTLGVQPIEITLLPIHLEWLSRQAGGASATVRRLIEEAIHGTREGRIPPT